MLPPTILLFRPRAVRFVTALERTEAFGGFGLRDESRCYAVSKQGRFAMLTIPWSKRRPSWAS